jgi:hypothetical protein
MSSFAQRASVLAIAAATLAVTGAPAAAQDERAAVLSILVECAKVDDPTARLACYDNNMTRAGATARVTVPGRGPRITGGSAPLQTQGSQGFGYEDVRGNSPARFQLPAGQLEEIHPRIASIALRGPGIYRFELEDGAQWEFAEGVSSQFRPPRRGDEIEIERGFGGSFLMRTGNQPPVPVKRIK